MNDLQAVWASSGIDCPLPDLKVDSRTCAITHNTHSLCETVLNLRSPGALHKRWGSLQTIPGNKVPTLSQEAVPRPSGKQTAPEIFLNMPAEDS